MPMSKWLHVVILLIAPLLWGLAVEYVFHRIRSRRGNGQTSEDRP